LFAQRGGLGEYLRGASQATAHLDSCTTYIDRVERAYTSCWARWTAAGMAVTGLVVDVDAAGWKAVGTPPSAIQYEVQIPEDRRQLRVFAHGIQARPVQPSLIRVGAGFLAVTAALLAWSLLPLARRIGVAAASVGDNGSYEEVGHE
jgi:hypothetical protein